MKVNPNINCIIADDGRLNFYKPKYAIENSFDNVYNKTIIDLILAQYKKGFYLIYRLNCISKVLILLINNRILPFYYIQNNFENNKINIIKILWNLHNKSIKAYVELIKFNERIINTCKNIISKNNSNITFKEIINKQIRKVPILSSYKVINLKSISLIDINYENLKESYIKIIKDVYVEDI